MKNINEELNHMKYLFGYKKGVVISEQNIINENIINENINFDQDKTILDLDYDKISLEEQVRKKINVGADVRTGNKHPRAWGKHGGHAGFDLNIDWYNEVSVNLQTSSDLLAKMEKELKSTEWEKVPYEIKIQLAAGFFDSINDGLNSDYVKSLSRKQRRDYKKFFKKAQRWRFQMDKMSKIVGGQSKDKVVITIPAENDSAMEAYNNSLTTINELNKNNSDMETIMGKVCNYIGIEEETTQDGRKIQKAQSWYFQKAPLQTVIMYEEQPPRKYIEKAQGSVVTKDTVEVDIPQAPTNFAAGKAEIPSSYINDVVENIYSQLMSKVFEANMADYGLQKKTGAEIVKDFQNGQGDGIVLEFIDTTSSASNTWSKNEILDFTHNNDGTKVKEFDQLDQTGNNKKNSALSALRNGNLTNGVIAGLKRMPGIIVNINDVEYSQDIRVTDTGGKIDEDPVRAEGKPNKGQYAGFKLGFYADITDTKVQPQQDRLTATYGQRVITLKWVGKKDLPGINIDLVWEYKPGVKNKILKKNIITGELQPGGRRWSKLRGYK